MDVASDFSNVNISLRLTVASSRLRRAAPSFSVGAFDMNCGCMKRPARVAACSRGGVENGSVKLDIPASRGLLP